MLTQQESDSLAICTSSKDLDSILAFEGRTNSDVFVSYVLKTELGESIAQAAIHREIQWHIDECLRRGENYCGILAPWGHGKTEQVAIGRTLKFLGENRNNRVFIVCNTDDNAKARVQAIRNYISFDRDYRRVFPEVKEADTGDWSKHKIVVERESMSKDGSVESWGVTSSGTGGRCDKIIFDDPVDLKNAILNPASRKTVKENFKNVWMPRLVPGGFALYVATLWHKDDNTSELLKNPAWKFLIMSISDDYAAINCDSPFKGKYCIPLWQNWSRAALLNRLSVIGQRAFDRGFRQKAMTDEDRTFPHSDGIFDYGLGPGFVDPSWPRVTGVDPFGKQVVVFTIAIIPGSLKRVPVDIRRGKWNSIRAIKEILDVNAKQKPILFVVENNAAQDAIIQWAREKGGANLNIMPFTTGSQKASPDIGLPSMDVEFENGSWIVPMGAPHEPGCECNFCVWKTELEDHPVAAAADTVMASWFAREGVRLLLAKAEEPAPEDPHEVITQEDVGLERVTIGEDY